MDIKEIARVLGALGGKARAARLTQVRRTEIARQAATKRWERGAKKQ